MHIARNGHLFVGPDSVDIYRTTAPVAQSSTVATVGIAATGTRSTLSITPNPVETFLKVSLQGKGAGAEIAVLNAVGQVQRSERILAPATEKVIGVADLPAGMYFLRVLTGAETLSLPFVKR